jgi:phospholipase/carboxylesterase
MTSRREFVRTSAAAMLAAAVPFRPTQSATDGRLSARPVRPTGSIQPGMQPLNLGTDRDGVIYVPELYRAARPAPLVLWLHGAGGSGQTAIVSWWKAKCDELGIVVLAPDSRDRTWDGVLGGFGPDVAFIDRALASVFTRCAIDPARMAVAGFSDGGSYAVSLGLINGDVFRKTVAFSPGFIVPGEWRGSPEFFVSHGRSDPILPIDATGRRVVTALQRGGYRVQMREFAGGHTMPPEIRDEAVRWITGRS